GEFGVAIIIAYFPHGIPIQMWVNLQDIGPQAVYPLLWMLILVAMPVPLLLSLQVERGWGGWFNVLGKLSGLLDRLAPVRSGACPATAAGKRAEHHNPIHINILISSPVALKADFCLRGITAITGPTGSGKTTLLRAIAGVIPCKMTTATHTALASRRMGYAPQQPLLFPHLTVLRNVAFGLNGPDRQSRARLILEKLGLEHLDEKMPAALSAGQAQLVCVARALACEPDLLLLDEPTAALDFGTSDAFMYMLREMTRTANITILLATHDRDIARASDAWLSIVNGELIWSSPISQSEIQVPLVY
ncbi:MAG TPA: ATP-binding cassette domain-containing protein, partial [Phycisphaerae bacterium]|nr:ATP-binding cassette domain-containing protein [Phycisphaerae bacterium]